MKSKLFLMAIILAIIMVGTVSAAQDVDDTNQTDDAMSVPNMQTQSFTNLSGEIEKENTQFNMTVDYRYEESDGDYSKGILIDKNNYKINGNGHFIDGANKTRIFRITGTNITISNLILKNSTLFLVLSGACNITTINVTFQGKISTENGIGAVGLVGTVNYTSINDTFIECYAKEEGSAIYASESEISVINATFENRNPITWSLIFGYYSQICIENTTFSNVRSTYATALYNRNGNIRIKNSRFINLSAKYTGGALAFKNENKVEITNCQFINVTASNDGGAIFADLKGDGGNNYEGYVLLTNTLFDNCSASYGGACIQLGGGLGIIGCNFTKNSAISGGAIYSTFTTTIIENSTFESNTASKGGAILSDYTTLEVDRCNFTCNTQGICMYDSLYAIINSTFKDNTEAIYSEFNEANSFEKDNEYQNDSISLNNENYPEYVFEMGKEIITNPVEITANINDSYFNLRDINATGSVKNQGSRGICWALCLIDILESEYYLATGQHITISANNLQNFLTRYSPYGYRAWCEGGRIDFGAGYLLSWLGFEEEDYDTYDCLAKIFTPLNSSETFHLLNAMRTKANDYNDYVKAYKELLLKYGAFGVSTTNLNNVQFYNSATYGMYCNESKTSHAVAIVGWNDSYPASNFNTPPEGDGAWIAKNSWGDTWGDEGYFYISYYDMTLKADYITLCLFNSVMNYNRIYQYDLLGGFYSYKSDENKPVNYTNHYESVGDEMIAAVGTYFETSGQDYNITVYVNGEEVYTQSGKASFAGYETIELNKLIPIRKGDKFAVKISSNNAYYIKNTRQHFMQGRSIIEYYDETLDLASRNEVACIKVYTLAKETDSFTRLKEEIEKDRNEFNMTRDYLYEDRDGDYTEGILIDKNNYIINGNGHFIDGANKTRIFHITGTNITITNLVFKNTIVCINIEDACNITTINVTFQDKTSTANSVGAVRTVNTKNYTSINDRFIECYAKDYGSAIYTYESEITLINATIENRHPITWSLIYASNSKIVIENTTFSNIRSTYATVLYNQYGDTRIKNSKFINLSAKYTGGALVFKESNNVEITNCQFINVTASNDGGAIFTDIVGSESNDNGYVLLTNTIFDNCSASYGGTCIQLGGELEIIGCNFTKNSAISGGAVYTSFTTAIIKNSTFESNTASKGGAIISDYAYLEVDRCEFTHNTQSIYMCDSLYAITNSTFKDNTEAIYSEFDQTDSFEKDNKYQNNTISLNNENYPTYIFEMGKQITANPVEINASVNDTYFNLRDLNATGPVKNQGSRGACWAFSLSEILESAYYLTTGQHITISPNNIQNSIIRYSPYGNIESIAGGRIDYAIGYLLSWLGFEEEDYDAYDTLAKIWTPTNASETFHLLNAMHMSYTYDPSGVDSYKELLLKYGAIAVSTKNPNKPDFYNSTTYGYYCDVPGHENHYLIIVGWNDSYPASNFNTPPEGDGAWIAKNTWGDTWGDGGYCYISYYDQAMREENGICIFSNVMNYNRIYQYNIIGSSNCYYTEDPLNYTNHYESADDEMIAAVGTYFETSGQDYNITIYVNGEEVYTQSGKSTIPGYETIELNKLIPIRKGDKFAVKISSYNAYIIENTRQHFMQGRSIIEYYDETLDLASRNEVACIKVYTLAKETDSFTRLKEEIEKDRNEFNMTRDYLYEDRDGDYTEGILIDKNNYIINGNGHFIDGANKTRIFRITGTNITITNLVFKNAILCINIEDACNITTINVTFQDKTSTANSVGAVRTIYTVNYTSINDRFIECYAKEVGSAIYAIESEISIINATIENRNPITWSLIYASQSQIVIENTTFSNIRSTYATVLYNEYGDTRIKNSKFINLSAKYTGGALAFKESNNVEITNCQFINVTASNDGGAIFTDIAGEFCNDNGHVLLINTLFDNCSASYGGAYIQLGGELEITGCNFTKNSAISGGAIYTSFTIAKIKNSAFKSNTASKGGAIISDYTTLEVNRCEFTHNTQAIYMCDSKYTITNSTFKDNTEAIYSEFDQTDSIEKDNTYQNNNISLGNENYPTYIFEMGKQIIANPVEITANINDTYFNLRDINATGPVKDQADRGVCWAFCLSEILESAYYLTTGQHITITANNLQNFLIRYSPYGWKEASEGGELDLPIGYLLSWLGFEEEAFDAYDALAKIFTPLNPSETFHLLNAMIMHNAYDSSSVDSYKELLLKYGAIGVTTHDPNIPDFYNSTTYGYNCNVPDIYTHVTIIVGWNDSYPASNFNIQPEGDGAWIAKNTWGDTWGDEGYFYISYYDQAMRGENIICIFTNVMNYNRIYQYDIMGAGTSYIGENSPINYTNHYESVDDEMIGAVGTYFAADGQDYNITIYVNGEEVYTQSGKSTIPGYETIELNKLIPIRKGDKFAVKISSYNAYIIENTRQHFMQGRSIMELDGQTIDLASRNQTACIKAYTLSKESDSFTKLQEEINNASETFILRHDYIYNTDFDKEEITIEKNNIIIDGQGHTIDARNMTSIFRITGCNVTLKNIVFANANGKEGSAVKTYENLTVIGCRFENNTATAAGGAIWAGSNLTLINSTFIRNSAEYCGAVCVGNSLDAWDCLFADNTAAENGGAVSVDYVNMTNCLFENNTAGNIGALYVYISGEITNSTFIANHGKETGALEANDGLIVRNSYFANNTADEYGGAISTYGPTEIDNTTFENNSAKSGGAIFTSAETHITNSTFKANRADDGSDDIAVEGNHKVVLDNVTPANTAAAICIYEEMNVTNATYGDSVKIVIRVFSYNAPYAANGTASISLNGRTYTADIMNGNATLEIRGLDVGAYSGEVMLDCGANCTRTGQNVSFEVMKRNVTIAAKDKTYIINYGGKYAVSVANLASDVKVTFALDGKVIASTTTSKGSATITLTSKMLKAAKAGKRKLVISISDKNYNYAEKTVRITISKEKTKITAKKKTFRKSKKVKKYTVTLKNSQKKAIKKAKVTLKIKGKTYKAKTNKKGKATFKIKKLKKGKYTATVKYKGNKYYKKSSKKVKITLK